MPSAEGYDLRIFCLSDELNLTGRVKRRGVHAAISGGCANVWEGEFGGEKVAVKVIREVGTRASKERLQKRLVREVRAWSKLYHRNVLNLLGFAYGFDASSTLASLVSPWMPKGTATRYLEKRSAAERIRVLTGVADGLCYLHRHDVVHGDLKGDNILIDMRGEPRLADFGLSKLMTEVQVEAGPVIHTFTDALPGSVRWMARELIEATDITSVSCESDIWAFGMTSLEFFTSLPPYHHLRTDPQVIIHIHKGVLPERPDISSGLDDALWDLCLDCWHENPALRPSTRVIAKRLWELDLQCKLRARTKRRSREPDSPDSEHGRLASCEERLRKSPKLSTLAELSSDESPSPGSPLSASRALMRTPTPRSASMSASSSSSLSDSSRSSSFNDFSDVDPRRFFTSTQSDGDLYTQLHRHHHERLRTSARGYSESSLPTSGTGPPHIYRATDHPHRSSGLGLEIAAYPDPESFDPSTALVSPRQTMEGSPRQPTHPLTPLDVHQYHQQSHQYTQLPGDANLYYEQFPHNPYDPMHPSQWQYIHPVPYTNNSSTSYELAMLNDRGDRTPSSYADFLTLPTQEDPSTSPQDSDVLSPHEIGPLFSEAFISEPLSYEDQGASSQPQIDFESYRQGIISPALSDATPTEFLRQVFEPDHLAESPLIQDYSSFDAFEDDDLCSDLSLFGGVGIAEGDVSLFASVDVGSSTPTERTPRLSPRGLPPTPGLSPLLSSF